MSANVERNISIDIAKGIAIILVVVGHVIQFGSTGEGYWSNRLFQIIYSFHMPLFIFLSGYVSVKGIINKKLMDTIKNKFLTLIIPFLSWGIVMFLYSNTKKIVFNTAAETNVIKYLIDVVLYPGKGLWFLWVLFFLNILLALPIKLAPKYSMVNSIVLYLFLLLLPSYDLFYVFMIKWLYPFFFIGAYLSMHRQKTVKINKPISIIFAVLFPILLIWWDKNDYVYISKMRFSEIPFNNFLNFSYRYLIAFAGISLVLILSKYIMNSLKAMKIFNKTGSFTIDIYALEALFLPFLSYLPYTKTGYLYLLYIPIASTIIITISCVISKLIIRKVSFFNKIFLGGR